MKHKVNIDEHFKCRLNSFHKIFQASCECMYLSNELNMYAKILENKRRMFKITNQFPHELKFKGIFQSNSPFSSLVNFYES